MKAPKMDHDADDPQRCDWVVRVEWIRDVPLEKAHWEKGFFANQNTVCRLRNRFTLERLVKHFELDE